VKSDVDYSGSTRQQALDLIASCALETAYETGDPSEALEKALDPIFVPTAATLVDRHDEHASSQHRQSRDVKANALIPRVQGSSL
jgi:hypothetical protein